MTTLIDSHAHLLRQYYPEEVDATLERAFEAGVGHVINVGTKLEDSHEALELAEKHDKVYATVGVHPHEAASLDQAVLATLDELLDRAKVVALGECGLDYHYDHAPRETQREALRLQARLAVKKQKPLVVHNRDSDADLVDILGSEETHKVGGVIHSFTAPPDVARQLLDLDFHLGFGGIVTFKSADQVRASLKACPIERVLLETDCPYLTPVPHRGKRNEPAYLRWIAEKVAEVKGLTFEEVSATTTANCRRLFGLSEH